MKRKQGNILTLLLIVIGVLLVSAAVVSVVVSKVSEKNARENAAEIAAELYEIMPDVKDGSFDDRVNMAMPMIELDGENFAGILEIPRYNTCLPVCCTWSKSKLASYPCRYMGSLYDGSLIIGGSGNPGQFDFMKTVSVYDTVYVTDVTGACYSYEVTDIKIVSSAVTENLTDSEAQLVLFARDAYSDNYTVLSCKRK